MQAPQVKKILIICGPTSTGKTKLALYLAELFKGDVISADSRQVFRGMDIGTGKDISCGAKFVKSPLKFNNEPIGFYEKNDLRLWGLDLVDPGEGFSVSDFVKSCKIILAYLYEKKRLPVMVGGTGFYIKALLDGVETISIPPNPVLRTALAKKTVSELFDILAQLDPSKAASLNVSDKKNPRRLIRGIEVAMANDKNNNQQQTETPYDVLFIGLSAEKNVLAKKIHERVLCRVKAGILEEINSLVKQGVSWESQAMSGLGYRQWKNYLAGRESMENAIKEWEKEEIDYAKRQMTWFKRDPRIKWFDVSNENFTKEVEELVRKWYDSK